MSTPNHRTTGSTSDALAKIEAENELRAAQAEAASRKQAADNAAADAKLAADRVAAEQLRLNPPTPVVVPVITWQPTETLNADAVRTAVATFGRTILDTVSNLRGLELLSLGVVGPILAAYEPGQLTALLSAVERGAGLKAAPRHTDDCLTLRAFMAKASMAVVCIATCPMVGYKPPVASGGTPSTPSTGSGPGKGNSAGNVQFVVDGVVLQDNIAGSIAVRAAAEKFPTAARSIAWVASPTSSSRLPMQADIDRGNVPAGTFGPTIVATKATPADAAYPFTPAVAA